MEQVNQKNKINKTSSYEDKIKDARLKEIFLILKSRNLVKVNKINWNGEIEENIKQEIKESLQDKIKDLNDKFSELRRAGKDLGVLNFKLMILPLKIKIFFSTYDKKDLENLLMRINEIENEIEKYQK